MKPRPLIWMGVIAVCVTVSACNNTPGNNAASDQTATTVAPKDTTNSSILPVAAIAKNREEMILDSIGHLPFIIAANKNIDSITQHKKGIAFIIDSAEKEWMIQAGYNGPDRFETYHRLYVNPATFAIKVYDVVNDTAINLADYLKNDEQ